MTKEVTIKVVNHITYCIYVHLNFPDTHTEYILHPVVHIHSYNPHNTTLNQQVS